MRKLEQAEEIALDVLREHGGYCPGDDIDTAGRRNLVKVLDSLVKKKRAFVEVTDSGPKYHAA